MPVLTPSGDHSRRDFSKSIPLATPLTNFFLHIYKKLYIHGQGSVIIRMHPGKTSIGRYSCDPPSLPSITFQKNWIILRVNTPIIYSLPFSFFCFPHIEMMKIVGIVRINNADLCYLVSVCLLAKPILVSTCVELAEQTSKFCFKRFSLVEIEKIRLQPPFCNL